MGSATRAVTGVILAGGRASRMGGRNKALAAIDGETIAARTLRLFRRLFPQVLVATNEPEPYQALGADVVRDVFPGAGPLAGIHAAMQASRHPHLFVAACDMPGLDAGVIDFLLRRIGEADAIVPCWEDDVEPLHAVYALRVLPDIEACLREGRCAMRQFLPLIQVDYVTETELQRLAGTASSFTNVNTPEELAALGGRFEDGER
jgi:molybdopterin-guanine dinucleotide biosynthesis protein A